MSWYWKSVIVRVSGKERRRGAEGQRGREAERLGGPLLLLHGSRPGLNTPRQLGAGLHAGRPRSTLVEEGRAFDCRSGSGAAPQAEASAGGRVSTLLPAAVAPGLEVGGGGPRAHRRGPPAAPTIGAVERGPGHERLDLVDGHIRAADGQEERQELTARGAPPPGAAPHAAEPRQELGRRAGRGADPRAVGERRAPA